MIQYLLSRPNAMQSKIPCFLKLNPQTLGLGMIALLLSACGSNPIIEQIPDGPPPKPFDASGVPDAVPRVEPRSAYGNPTSYVVRGVRYYVMPSAAGYRERGYASWYGKKFHGRPTSSTEPYDMFGMTAAHRTLPLPTYARVTAVETGKSVIVRINDRGPFHPDRVLDLSYSAALKLGVVKSGVALVDVEALDPASYTQSAPYVAPPAERSSLSYSPQASQAAPRFEAVDLPNQNYEPPVELPPVSAPSSELPPATYSRPSAPRSTPASSDPNVPAIYQPEYEIIPGGSNAGVQFFLQAGAFSGYENLQERMNKLVNLGYSNLETQESSTFPVVSRVFVGPFTSETGALSAQQRLAQSGIQAVIVQR